MNQAITSSNGRYRFFLQSDGNVVMLDEDDQIKWQSRTSGSGAVRISMQADGQFVLYDASGEIVWSSVSYSEAEEGSEFEVLESGDWIIYRGGYIYYSSYFNGPIPCGTTLDPAYYPLDFGYDSGVYFTGETIYPGTGDFSECQSVAGTSFGPARITSDGAYVTCTANQEFFSNRSARFFYNHPDLWWISTSTSNINSVDGKLASGTYQGNDLFVSRKDVESSSKGRFSQIGRISSGNNNYWNGQTEISGADTYDVLVCLSYSSGYIESGSFRYSADGSYSLRMQGDGNLALYEGGSEIWSSGTSGSGYRLRMNSDGYLVIVDSDDEVVWSRPAAGQGVAGSSYQIVDGQLRIMDGKRIIWSSSYEGGKLLN